MNDFKDKAREYLAIIPGDAIQNALIACGEYVKTVFEHESYIQMRVLCTDRESRENWQSQVSVLDTVRHNAHEKLMSSIRAANAKAVEMGMEPLFPLKNDAPRTEFGNVAIMVVDAYFNNRQ